VHEPYIKHIEDRIWEMRLRGRDGIARAVYVTAPGRRVVILPVFTKKTQKTPRREIELARQRATVSGRTFQVSPPWIWVTLTTALSSGWSVAAGNRLKTVHDLRRGNDRIDHKMRHRRMAPAAFDRDLENVKGGHHRSRPDRELADRQLRPIVHAIDASTGYFSRTPSSITTRAPPSFSSAGWKMKWIVPAKLRVSARCCAPPSSIAGMAIVTAGMHPPALLRSMGKQVLLVYM
jgi:hypothetical protein